MTLVEFLQGKWLGHPLHAAVVHVPVGGWLVACALDVSGGLGWGGPTAQRVAQWCVGAGLAGALLAVPTGVADWSGIKKGKPAWKLGLYHMVLNLIATVVWAVNFGLRFQLDERGGGALPILLTSVVGTLTVLTSAYVGSLMAFDHGIAVARTSKKRWREVAVRAGARVAEEK